MFLDFLVAVGTIGLAVFAFLEIRTGVRSRKVSDLEADADRILAQEGGNFLHDLRSAILRWERNPELRAAMDHMSQRHRHRILEFREEMRELKPLLTELRRILVTLFPDAEDGGMLVADLASSGAPDDW